MLLFLSAVSAPTAYEEPDELLIHRIGEDDAAAFHEFYDATRKTVYAYCLSLVRNHHDAEDVMHDTYLKVRSAAHLYEPMGKPMAWVFTIAKNLSLMKLRAAKRNADEPVPDLGDGGALRELMDAEDRLILKELLNDLDETERTVIMLHAVSGYTHAELARRLNIPLGTVLSKYHRGLKKLRNAMGGSHES